MIRTAISLQLAASSFHGMETAVKRREGSTRIRTSWSSARRTFYTEANQRKSVNRHSSRGQPCFSTVMVNSVWELLNSKDRRMPRARSALFPCFGSNGWKEN
jgi:hypothetical protein